MTHHGLYKKIRRLLKGSKYAHLSHTIGIRHENCSLFVANGPGPVGGCDESFYCGRGSKDWYIAAAYLLPRGHS